MESVFPHFTNNHITLRWAGLIYAILWLSSLMAIHLQLFYQKNVANLQGFKGNLGCMGRKLEKLKSPVLIVLSTIQMVINCSEADLSNMP